MQLTDILLVAAGGGVGSLLRWGAGKVIPGGGKGGLPWSTIFINVTGAFVIGYLSVLFSVEWHDRYGTPLNSAILTGLLGGYTTFSTMELDAGKMFRGGAAFKGTAYLVGLTIVGVIFAGLGAGLARAAG